MRKFYALTLFLFLSSFTTFAQTGKHFSVEKELSSSLINDVYQDSNGIIWIATEDGLNRYDASKFSVYKQSPNNQNSLLHDLVRVLFEDSEGHLLVGFFNGLQIYDDATDDFTEIPLTLENGEKFGAHVFTILERKNGDILVGTSGQGIFSVIFEGDSVRTKQIRGQFPSDHISHLYEDKDQNLWVSTQDKGLFRLDSKGKLRSFGNATSIEDSNISCIIEDKQGNLYLGSWDDGLFRFDEALDSFVPVDKQATSIFSIATMHVSREGTIYLGTDGQGMKTYDPRSNRFIDTNFNVSSVDLSQTKVYSIIEDNSGNIWAGMYQKGVAVLPASTSNFKYIGQKSGKDNNIGSKIVSAVFKDHDGVLWVGTDGDGLYSISPDGKTSTHYPPKKSPGSVPATIMTIYEDSNNDLWLGSYNQGMAIFNRERGDCKYFNNFKAKNSITDQHVFSFQEDENKQLWIGSMGSGLSSLDLNTKKVTNYRAARGTEYRPDANTLHSDWINCLFLTKNGKLFIGTFDGLGCFDIKTQSFTSSFEKNRLLPGEIVYSVYEDSHETIWIGTSEGLKYISANSTQIYTYTTEDGLPSNVICAITGDSDNNLWISTNYGISKMNLKSRDFVNFYSDDGLQGNEFSKNAMFKDKDGEIVFGGFNGITFFHPKDITDIDKNLVVRIADFYIHDKPVRKGLKSGNHDIISTSVKDAEAFNLSHEDNSFTIEFSVMEFINPERITYMYSMNGGSWITLRPGTKDVTFNNLAPGNYSFKVKAKDYNSYSNEKEIAIIVNPAWYFSPIAKLLYVLCFMAIGLLFIYQIRQRYRARKKMLEHLHAKQINEAKLQFFINIAHEIRTPMSLIISPLKKLMKNDNNSENQRAYTTMHKSSERILLLINQLMDIRKIDKGQMRLQFQEVEIVAFTKELCSIFDEQKQTKHISIEFHHEIDRLNVWIDPNNFDKIVLNVLSNAMKYTPEDGAINVYLKVGDNKKAQNNLTQYFELVISDNGIGIPEHELEKVFDCFYQTQTAPNNFSEGTGIGLHLSRSIAELHHGTITAENNKEKPGCRFIIRVPLGSEHLNQSQQENTLPILTKSNYHAIPSPLLSTGEEKGVVKSKTKYNLLVVDDDREIREYLSQELAADFNIASCVNGKEALIHALKQTPDLVISDVMMPEMDGITLCRKIKQNVNINHVPVILLTAKSEEEDNLTGLGIGADAYIVKPFNIEILHKTVQNIIRNREILRNNFGGSQGQKDKVQDVKLKSADEKLMIKIMDVINENISNPEFSVEMLAKEIGISRVHLHRKTKELTNQSSRDLIKNIRLQQAANLLASKNLNISEVAYAVGYNNLATFSTAFKEIYGESPSIYMESHLKTAG